MANTDHHAGRGSSPICLDLKLIEKVLPVFAATVLMKPTNCKPDPKRNEAHGPPPANEASSSSG